jgi:nucleoside-diphosphate-sugar epimerase
MADLAAGEGSAPRVVITGGAGFLGYNLAPWCAARGAVPAILDIARCDPRDYPETAELVLGDVRDPDAVRAIIAPPNRPRADVVVHAAAALPLWPRREILSTNVAGTRTVLSVARELGVDRVIFVSSTAVYGVTEKHPLLEDDPLAGVGPYGVSKIRAEALCAEYRELGLCVPVIRPKTFLGTGRLGVFQILYEWVRDGKRIPMIGAGNNRYQLLDVEDVCDAIWRLMQAPRDDVNAVFNVGAERFGTVRADLETLCEHAGSGARVLPVPASPAKLALRFLEKLRISPLYRWIYGTADKDSYVSIERIQSTLGWRPRYSNAESLIRAYDWYLSDTQGGAPATGVTHRVAWDQGALRLLKRCL